MATVADKVKALIDWAPALSILSEISGAQTAKERAVGACKLMRFVATRTATKIDDDLIERIEALLLSPEGDELFRYIVGLIAAVSAMEVE